MDALFFTLIGVTAASVGFIAGAIFGITCPHHKEHD